MIRNHPKIPPNFAVRIDFKGPNTAEPTVKLVGRLGMAHRIGYSSFDHSRILEVRKLEGDAGTGAIFDFLPADFTQQAIAAGADEVRLNYDMCPRDAVQLAHRAGLQTMAWFRAPRGMRQDFLDKYYNVRNEDVDMYRMVLRSGVESMCVNRPDVIVRALAEAQFESIRLLPEQ
jgi:glycerophosphoryl diester phosphodiesterase